MNDEQFESFAKIIKHDCFRHMKDYLDEQISKHPDKEDFYEGVRKSEFFREFFEVGFVSGISWQEHNKNTKYVL